MKKVIDDYSQHEALDRSSMLAQMVGIWLLEHPAIQAAPKVRRKVEKAVRLLSDAYQEIGAAHLPLPIIDPELLEVGKEPEFKPFSTITVIGSEAPALTAQEWAAREVGK